ALERGDGPFSLRYPRDKAPAEAPPAAEVAPVPYGSWEILRRGRDCALLAVGVMCRPALDAAAALAGEGWDLTVVNCRFLKPIDRARSEEHTSELQSLRHLVCRLLLEKKKKRNTIHDDSTSSIQAEGKG